MVAQLQDIIASYKAIRRRFPPTTSPRRSPSSNGSPTTISPFSAFANTASPAARNAASSAGGRTGLGILADPKVRVLSRGGHGVTTTPAIREFLMRPEPLIVTKSNLRSRIHRRAYADYVGVKRYRRDGKLAGEIRFIGLFTSTAYNRSVLAIPYLRRKAASIIARAGFGPASHSGQGARQRAGILSARRTLPERRGDAVPTSSWRSWRSPSGRASGCSPGATSSTASSRSSSSCRATATTATSASGSAPTSPRSSTGISRPITRPSSKAR